MNIDDTVITKAGKMPSTLIRKEERKKEIKRLAQTTKQRIVDMVAEYKDIIQKKGQKLMRDVDEAVLSLLESMNDSENFFEQNNMSNTIEDRLTFSAIQKQLSNMFHSNSVHQPQSQYKILCEKLEAKLESHLIKQQKLQEQFAQLKRKYKNKHQSTTVTPLPLPSIAVLATRHQKENQMLIEQNNLLSNRLIEMQSENSKYKLLSNSAEIDQRVNNFNPQQSYQPLKQQIIALRDQLASSNERLLDRQSRLYQSQRLLEMETQRTTYQTSRAQQLLRTISKLQNQIQNLETIIKDSTLKLQQVKNENIHLQKAQSQLVRKQILTEVIKQLNEQTQTNRILRQDCEVVKNKLKAKDDDLRNKEIYYIEKLDEYSLISKQNYDQLVKTHNQQMIEKQSELKSVVIALNNRIENHEEKLRIKQQDTIQLTTELQETKINLKQLKKTTRKSTTKKNEEEKQLCEQTHLAEIKMFTEQISKFKSEYKLIRESYGEKIALLEARNKIIKQKFCLEVLSKLEKSKEKNSKNEMMQVAENLVASFNNIVHKETLINRLTKQVNDLKSKKQKEKEKQKQKTVRTPQQSLLVLNCQIFEERVKLQKSMYEQKISISEQKLSKCQLMCRQLQLKNQQIQARQSLSMQKVKQLQKLLKEKKSQNVQISNDKLHQQEIQEWKAKYSQIRKLRDDLQLEVKIKKDALNHMKSTIKGDQSQTNSLKKSNEELKQEIEKLKKCIKEHQRKQLSYKDIKQKMQATKALQKQNEELRSLLEQKTRSFKQQISKKDFVIKLHKEKEKQAEDRLRDLSTIQAESPEIKHLQEVLQKQRMQVERKDQLIKVYKEKIEKLEQKLAKQQHQLEQKSNQSKIQLLKENKKVEQLKMDIKKSESQLFTLRGVLKKVNIVFKQFSELNKKQTRAQKKTARKIPNLQIFSQGLSILNINVEEVHDLLPGAKDQQTVPESKYEQMKFLINKITDLAPIIKQTLEQ